MTQLRRTIAAIGLVGLLLASSALAVIPLGHMASGGRPSPADSGTPGRGAPAPSAVAPIESVARSADAPDGVPVDGPIGPGLLGTGGFPYGGAYDPRNNELYIADQTTLNVTVLNASTGATVTSIPLTSDPLTATFVPNQGEVYISVEGSHDLAIVNPQNNTIASTINLAGDPEYTVYDPDNSCLYLSEWTSETSPLGVQRVYTTNSTTSPVVTSGFDEPLDLTVDTANDTVWVMNLGSGRISVLSAENNTVVRTFAPTFPAGSDLQGGIVYVNATDQVFVDNDGSPGAVDAYDASNYSLIAKEIPVGPYAYGASLTFDPASERVFVGSYYADTVSVVSVLNDSIATTALSIPGGPWVGVFDPSTGALFFLLSSGNATAWIFGGLAVDAVEGGLPSGTPWSVTINGTTQNGTDPNFSFVLPAGNYSYSAGFVHGFGSTNPSGILEVGTVTDAPTPLAFNFLPVYGVNFTESGLPSGADWVVDLDGNHNPVGLGPWLGLGFALWNGSYRFTASTNAPGYAAALSSGGRFVVDGRPLNFVVTFAIVTYGVNFTETGLAEGAAWTVSIGSTALTSTNASMVFLEPNGTYPWIITPIAGEVTKWSGSATVDGGNVSVPVSFALATFAVTFTESGLPAGASWNVTVGTMTVNSTADQILFEEANGTFSFQVHSASNAPATPASGMISVKGVPSSEAIAFGPVGGSSGGGTGGALSGPAVVLLATAAVAVGAGAGGALLWRRRKSPP